jgi:hypothetical protein
MTEHLPECRLGEPCDIDISEHGFCSMQIEEQFFCIHCMGECICERLRACEQRVTQKFQDLFDQQMLDCVTHMKQAFDGGWEQATAAAVQIVEKLPCKCNEGADYCDGQTDAIAAILMLAKGDQP